MAANVDLPIERTARAPNLTGKRRMMPPSDHDDEQASKATLLVTVADYRDLVTRMDTGVVPPTGRAPRTITADLTTVALISAFAALISQRWTGVNSPDSEFYASLALHGSAVADRALDAAYLWTRLGYIAPVRGLVSTFGPWVGFEVWRILLIVIIVASTFAIGRLLTTRTIATGLTVLTALSSMVLAFLGNTYLTGTVMAALWLLLAAGIWGAARGGWRPALLAGAVCGWLVMINPYALGLGLAMWLALRIVQMRWNDDHRWRDAVRDAGVALGGAAAVFIAFWVSGRLIFPGRDWLQTYLNWNDRLDYSVFVSDPWIWVHDTAMLVPLIAILVSVIAVFATAGDRWAWTALAVGIAQAGATTAFMLAMPGPWLEAQHYVAKLWPGSLVAVSLSVCALARSRVLRPRGLIITSFLVIAVPGMVIAGRWEDALSGVVAVSLAAGILTAFVIAAVVTRPSRGTFDAGMSIALVAAVCAVFIGSQILQNGRGLLGIYRQYPLRGAFVGYDMDAQMASKLAIEDWLLSMSTGTDRIGLWTDPDRRTAEVAAMQLWGYYNLVSANPRMDPAESAALRTLRPTMIAMYAPDRQQIDTFFASLPAWTAPSALRCTRAPFLGIGTGEVWACVTRLTAIR